MQMDLAKAELDKMQIAYAEIHPIRNKDGIYLYRIKSENSSYVLKFFENEGYRREICNYDILKSLMIPTLDIISSTDSCLLMEDIELSTFFRLGVEEDLQDVDVAKKLAKWYKALHRKGKAFLAGNKTSLYDENDVVTLENIALIKTKTETENSLVWAELEKNFDSIKTLLQKAERTLTYNDFYYTNLIVARDRSSAFMFDFNLLGKGYAYADIRNVCSSLRGEAKLSFMDEYGIYNEAEKVIDDVVSVIVTLYYACRHEVFPDWAKQDMDSIENGFKAKIETLLGVASADPNPYANMNVLLS